MMDKGFFTDDTLRAKAEECKRELRHRKVLPCGIVEIKNAPDAFQGLRAVPVSGLTLPLTLGSGDSVIVDFGDHCVGYLHFSADHFRDGQITDSPIQLKFSFGEFPLEIVTPPEDYSGSLGSGWLQNETKTVVFTPCTTSLDRRYSFRYLKIERTDSAKFPMQMTDLYADCVSAVDLDDAEPIDIPDATLKRIYDMSLKTLCDCEQDVFEDGPKRDRRLWIGDLRLQAIADNVSFKNRELVKRCLYLFAAHRAPHGNIAPCMFPYSPPYVDGWYFVDYSLFFVSCLYDYYEQYRDTGLLRELYPIAKEQVERMSDSFDAESGDYLWGSSFIDWCPGLDKSIATTGVYIYVLRQFKELAELMGDDTALADSEIAKAKDSILRRYSSEQGLFVTASGQISRHSQIWAVLSGVLTRDESAAVLDRTDVLDPEYGIHTPYMMHCYIEALYSCGQKERAISEIKRYWGAIADFGFDCCPEIFNPDDHFEGPYGGPETNSACHAWSCTPVYWIHKYYNEL